jgi:hypothetical protein
MGLIDTDTTDTTDTAEAALLVLADPLEWTDKSMFRRMSQVLDSGLWYEVVNFTNVLDDIAGPFVAQLWTRGKQYNLLSGSEYETVSLAKAACARHHLTGSWD